VSATSIDIKSQENPLENSNNCLVDKYKQIGAGELLGIFSRRSD
jgi:hypothetical protein